MPQVQNLLSKILVLPQFLAPEECRALREIFDQQPDRAATIVAESQAPLDPIFTLNDLQNPAKIIESARSQPLAQRFLAKYLASDALARVATMRDVGDADERLGRA